MKEKILASIDEHWQRLNRITERGGAWENVSVSSSFMFLPTNEAIYGVPSGKVPKWNQIEVSEFGRVARLTHGTVEDSGMFVVVCTPNQHEFVISMAGTAGWIEDHVSIAFCKVPIYKDRDITRRCLLISVMKKVETAPDLQIRRPKTDAWFDTQDEEE